MPQVFQPAYRSSLALKNRLIHSATFECMANENGAVTDKKGITPNRGWHATATSPSTSPRLWY
jgi:hypothetical protein